MRSLRRPDSIAAALEGLANLRAAGQHVQLHTTVMRANAALLPRMHRLATSSARPAGSSSSSSRPAAGARRRGACAGRAGARAALALPASAAFAVPRQADLRPALPADRGTERPRAWQPPPRAGHDPAHHDVARVPLGQRLLLRLPCRRGLRLRLSAAVGRERARPARSRSCTPRLRSSRPSVTPQGSAAPAAPASTARSAAAAARAPMRQPATRSPRSRIAPTTRTGRGGRPSARAPTGACSPGPRAGSRRRC